MSEVTGIRTMVVSLKALKTDHYIWEFHVWQYNSTLEGQRAVSYWIYIAKYKNRARHISWFQLKQWLMNRRYIYLHFVQFFNFKMAKAVKIRHDDVIKWKYFSRYWSFVRGIHRSAVGSPHKGQWRGALIFLFGLRLNVWLSKQSRRWWV